MKSIDRDFIYKKILEVFPEDNPDKILSALDRYGIEENEREKDRVHIAIIKLCDEESITRLEHYISVAKQDYRDVLAWAEYPNQMKQENTENKNESSRLDREQYQQWLGK